MLRADDPLAFSSYPEHSTSQHLLLPVCLVPPDPEGDENIYGGHYTAARRYEFYFRVVKTFDERAQRVSKYCF